MADSSTRLSLLGRLRLTPTDQEAWGEFVERYGRRVFAWCRQWGLQEADAEDVAQDVISKLTQKMADFRYDRSRSFRAWLKTITQHALSDLIESRSRAVGSRSIPMLVMRLAAVRSKSCGTNETPARRRMRLCAL